MTRAEILLKNATVNMERLIEEIYSMKNPGNDMRKEFEMEDMLNKLEETYKKLPNNGAYASLRTTLRKLADHLDNTLEG